jgi:KUP system potassium uptake protein
MEAAYGLSITVTMLMTTVLLIFWLWRNRVNKIFIGIFALVYFAIELGFLAQILLNSLKEVGLQLFWQVLWRYVCTLGIMVE